MATEEEQLMQDLDRKGGGKFTIPTLLKALSPSKPGDVPTVDVRPCQRLASLSKVAASPLPARNREQPMLDLVSKSGNSHSKTHHFFPPSPLPC